MIYLQLLLSYLKIGFFGFGGGYAMLSLIQNEIVTSHGWLTATELSDVISISQMTPGPIAINCATYVGYLVTGNIWGSLIATFAVCLPPMTIMLLITRFYIRVRGNRYMTSVLDFMRPVMVGMIGAAALMLINRQSFPSWPSLIIFAAALLATWKKLHPLIIILLAAAAGILLHLISH